MIGSGLAIVCVLGCKGRRDTVLKVFHAGSLSVPFSRMEEAFEAAHPGVDVQREAYGSATAIRQVTDLGKRADVVASADYRLIDTLMLRPEPPYADWNVLFAGNSVAVVCAPHKDGPLPEDWKAALLAPGAHVGMSDPNQDPCGYRALFCLDLAGRTAGGPPGLFKELVEDNSNVRAERTQAGTVIRIPTAVDYHGRLVMRPKETDLVALLQAGVLSCCLLYRSVAVQHGLPFLEMPDEANLSRPDLAELYGSVRVVQYADRPDRAVEVQASPIAYSLTVPRSAPRPELAAQFVALVLSEQGRRVMEECGQAPLVPAQFSVATRADAAPFALP